MEKKYKRPFDSYHDYNYSSYVENMKFEVWTSKEMKQEEIDDIAKSAYKKISNKDEGNYMFMDLRDQLIGF